MLARISFDSKRSFTPTPRCMTLLFHLCFNCIYTIYIVKMGNVFDSLLCLGRFSWSSGSPEVHCWKFWSSGKRRTGEEDLLSEDCCEWIMILCRDKSTFGGRWNTWPFPYIGGGEEPFLTILSVNGDGVGWHESDVARSFPKLGPYLEVQFFVDLGSLEPECFCVSVLFLTDFKGCGSEFGCGEIKVISAVIVHSVDIEIRLEWFTSGIVSDYERKGSTDSSSGVTISQIEWSFCGWESRDCSVQHFSTLINDIRLVYGLDLKCWKSIFKSIFSRFVNRS